jgi:hypothetical protein
VSTMRDQYGRVTTIRCDAAGLPTEVRDHAGNVMRYRSSASPRTGSTYGNRWTSPGTAPRCASRRPAGRTQLTR